MKAAVNKFVSAQSNLRQSKMKTFVGLFLALALFECASAVTKEYHEKAMAAKDKCAKEFNVDEETIKQFVKQKKLPETQNGKCMLNCFMEEMKVLDNGKIIVDEMKANNKHKWEDPAIIAKADDVVEICAKKLSSEGKDKCDFSVEVIKCIVEHGMEKEIPLPDMTPKRR